MSEELTANEIEALRFIRASSVERGWPPSLDELGEHFGWKSKSTPHHLIRLLEARGLIARTPGVARGLTITEAGMVAVTETV